MREAGEREVDLTGSAVLTARALRAPCEHVRRQVGGSQVPLPDGAGGRETFVLGLRPESLELAPDGLAAEVQVVEEIGADAYVFCVADVGGETTKLVARTEARRTPDRGERVALRPKGKEAHLFDAASGERLPS